MRTLFIADLHLCDQTPDLNDLFFKFLRTHTHTTHALYILGDLFEAWIGDDDDSTIAREVCAHLHAFSQHAPVYFIAGNRDFMLGANYAKKANIQLLPENHIIDLYGKKILLTHGDELCTADIAYQRYRRIIRQSWLKSVLCALPLRHRQKIAHHMRAKSRLKQHPMPQNPITDVTEDGVQNALMRTPNIDIIIHGHTHRQNVHTHHAHGRHILRYVLPDWHHGEGGYLAIDDSGAHFFRLPEGY